LDEPTLGLDPQSRASLWGFIKELPERHNVTVFMTTHYMEEAEVCGNIAIIDNGKIIAEGSPEELKKTVGGDVIYLRTSDNELARGKIKEAFELEAKVENGELYITVEKGDACIPDLIRTLSEMVQSVRLQRPTLNDVFLKLTGKAIREEEATGMTTIKEEVRAWRRRH
jgi:ABC-2 type transport system ATP-binding protein